jgi:hypothetical protein
VALVRNDEQNSAQLAHIDVARLSRSSRTTRGSVFLYVCSVRFDVAVHWFLDCVNSIVYCVEC